MSALSAALGLLALPLIGMPIGQAFSAMGADAVFGPGCGDDSGGRTIEAPARWRSAPPAAAAALGKRPLTLMADLGDSRVRALHLARQAVDTANADACRAQLRALPGGPIRTRQGGGSEIYYRATTPVAGYPASYRAVFRPLRQQCRVMLTIG